MFLFGFLWAEGGWVLGGFLFQIVLCMSNTLELLFLSKSFLHGLELSHTAVPKFSHGKYQKHTFYTCFAGILIILIAQSKSITAALTLMLKKTE